MDGYFGWGKQTQCGSQRTISFVMHAEFERVSSAEGHVQCIAISSFAIEYRRNAFRSVYVIHHHLDYTGFREKDIPVHNEE